MTEEAPKRRRWRERQVKDQLAYAKDAARRDLERMGFDIIKSDNVRVCLIGCVPGVYEKKIMIRTGKITDEDRTLLEALRILPNQTKAIWCKRGRGWDIYELDYQNKVVQ